MTSEYVKFIGPERVSLQKSFLESQIEIIKMLRQYKQYERLKNEEFLLKIVLKGKIEQVLSNVYSLEKLLPKTKMRPKKTKQEESQIMREIDLSLEEEINMLKEKIAKLK